VTPARWWVAHKEGMEDWSQCRRLMQVRFGTEVENIAQKYTGESDPVDHVEQCRTLWSSVPKRNGYTNLYIHWIQFQRTGIWNWKCIERTTNWDELTQRFKVTFTFEHESPSIDAVLQAIQTKIFSEEGSMEVVPVCMHTELL
jgi:hypothetical protein